jgi:hypothetical protein
MRRKQLTPPDLARCQAEKPRSFMTLGGDLHERDRCSEAPTVIVTERKPGADGQRGSMSLCDACLAVAKKQLGATSFTVRRVKPRTRARRKA